MDRKFKYDIVTMIEAVECKPCLWDKSVEQYRDKILRRNAWRDVCRILEPEFDNMDNKTQEELVPNITNKWTHVRDSFMRSLKTKSGQGSKRKYVYAENMQFLLKNVTADETESSIQEQHSAPTIDGDKDFDRNKEPSASTTPLTSIPKRVKMNPVDRELLNIIRSKSPTRKEHQFDEDHAFLLSLLPTMKKICEDDKMDFRIEVMQLINKYSKRNKQRFNIVPSPQDSAKRPS